MDDLVPHHEERRLWIIGSLAALALFIGIFVYFQIQKNKQSEENTATLPALETPSSFTDFYGVVTANRDRTLTVSMRIQQNSGKQTSKTFFVTVSDQTILQRQPEDAPVTETTLDAIPIGGFVQVFADSDIANESTFAATRITYYPSSQE